MFRFTIRDVLWLTALVAIGAAWWVDHRALALLAAQMRSYKTLSEVLTDELADKNPSANITIEVNDRSISVQRRGTP
jgi:hypothetical protein